MTKATSETNTNVDTERLMAEVRRLHPSSQCRASHGHHRLSCVLWFGACSNRFRSRTSRRAVSSQAHRSFSAGHAAQ